MIKFMKGEKVVSPKAEERFQTMLAAIEASNPQINWEKYKAHATVRKYYRWLIPIFPRKKVFLDIVEIVEKTERTEITIPAEVFNSPIDWIKRSLGGSEKFCFRLNEMRSRKRLFTSKVEIKLESECFSIPRFLKTLWKKITRKGE